MATQRPGFARADTDIELTDTKGHSTSHDIEKEPATPEVTSIQSHGSPAFDASKEDHFGQGDVLHDAKDILTHVIHVDDDKDLSPWTFRAFFLGTFLLPAPRHIVLTYANQVPVLQSSHL